jgi:hypothetical protein
MLFIAAAYYLNRADPDCGTTFAWVTRAMGPLRHQRPQRADGRILVAVFIFWGWDSTVTVNEETEDSSRTPGIAAIISTIILVGIYVVVSFAAQAFAGPEFLLENSDDVLATLGTDVLGSPLDKLLVIAVLTSAAASTQTTILPTARTSLSMAFKGAAPKRFGNIHPALPDPVDLDHLDGRAVHRLVRGPDHRQRGHPVRVHRHPGAITAPTIAPDEQGEPSDGR